MNKLARLIAAIALLALFANQPVLAQSQDDDAAAAEEDDEDARPDPADDVFLPSEEIQADSEISFPSDI